MKPLNYSIWPEMTVWNSIKDGFSSITGKATDWIKNTFSRRLLS